MRRSASCFQAKELDPAGCRRTPSWAGRCGHGTGSARSRSRRSAT